MTLCSIPDISDIYSDKKVFIYFISHLMSINRNLRV